MLRTHAVLLLARNRLFSNLDPDTMRHQPGSLMGAISLVAGTTVGAGILALPNTTAPAGFTASAVALSGGAGYAMVTALLLAEVNMNTMCDLGGGGVSIVSMASRTLGARDRRHTPAAHHAAAMRPQSSANSLRKKMQRVLQVHGHAD